MSHMLISLQIIVKRLILGVFVLLVTACATPPHSTPQAPGVRARPLPVDTPAAPPVPATTAPTTPLPTSPSPSTSPSEAADLPPDDTPLPAPRLLAKSRWDAVRWRDLPGFGDDALFEAWNAWLRNCERPGPAFAPLCPQVRQLSIASSAEQRRWMVQTLQPYRISPLNSPTATSPSTASPSPTSPSTTDGLLTAYYEPVLEASTRPTPDFTVPLYRLPAALAPSAARSTRPWFTRQDIDTLPEARAALAGREIVWLANPVDALVLHIQGSGRLMLRDGNTAEARTIRVAFAGTNGQPYKSVGRWLIDQGQLRDASWPAIKQWITQNPQRIQEMLWSNPRYVFFKEEALTEADRDVGPKGAQGVPLTAGRSIAVDPGSIPYGTPVWLSSSGPTARLQRLVFAQDTGSAITGAVRADYYAGSGPEAGELAGRMKQGLALWALWPK